MDKVVFWRASVIFWAGIFLFVSTMEVLNHAYLHPLEVILAPLVFAILSAFRLSHEIRRRRNSI